MTSRPLDIHVLPAAAREIASLDRNIGRRVVEKIRWFVDHREDVKPEPLSGDLAGFYKLRVGDYRIIFEILREDGLLLVHHVGHRREVYRKAK